MAGEKRKKQNVGCIKSGRVIRCLLVLSPHCRRHVSSRRTHTLTLMLGSVARSMDKS
jgi:hypothetical protein